MAGYVGRELGYGKGHVLRVAELTWALAIHVIRLEKLDIRGHGRV